MKTSSELFKTVVCPVNCKYGAPMGRGSNDVAEKPKDQRIFNRAVSISDGYDVGGAYWGYPANLRVEYSRGLTYIRFYRT
jgi:hypothetical protein